MSIMTPRARSETIRLVRSSCSAIARRSCMSTWIETRRQSPILSIGISPMQGQTSCRAGRSVDDRFSEPTERQGESVGHRRLGDDAELEPEMDDGLRDLRPNAADDAVGPHQAGGRHGLDQVLRHQCVDGRHTGDVDDGDLGARGDDLFEQAFHDDLGARAVERADQR